MMRTEGENYFLKKCCKIRTSALQEHARKLYGDVRKKN